MKRSIALASVLVVMLAAACGRLYDSNQRTLGWRAPGEPRLMSFVLDNAVFQFTSPTAVTRTAIPLARNSGSIAAPLSAGTSPVAQLSPDETTLVFSTWRYFGNPPTAEDPPPSTGMRVAHPAVHAFDLASGTDRVFADGAISPVVSTAGDVAFVKGDMPDYYANQPFTGTIQVQSLTSVEPSTLVSASDNYRLVGWAGDNLLYYVQSEGEVLDLYAMSVGGGARLLAEGAGVIAISPDRTSVLVQRVGTTESDLALIDIASGQLLTRAANIAAPDGSEVGALQMRGDWLGDRVVASGVTFAGIVYLQVSDSGIGLEGVQDLGDAKYPMGVEAPRFSEDGTSVVSQAVIPPQTASDTPHAEVITCSGIESPCASVVPEPGFVGAAYSIGHVE